MFLYAISLISFISCDYMENIRFVAQKYSANLTLLITCLMSTSRRPYDVPSDSFISVKDSCTEIHYNVSFPFCCLASFSFSDFRNFLHYTSLCIFCALSLYSCTLLCNLRLTLWYCCFKSPHICTGYIYSQYYRYIHVWKRRSSCIVNNVHLS